MGRAARGSTNTGSGLFKKAIRSLCCSETITSASSGKHLRASSAKRGPQTTKNRCTPSASKRLLTHVRIGQNRTASSISGLECAGTEESSSKKKTALCGRTMTLSSFTIMCLDICRPIISNFYGKSSLSSEFVQEISPKSFPFFRIFLSEPPESLIFPANFFAHFQCFAKIPSAAS